MTSTYAGAYSSAAGHWGLAQLPWSGTIVAAQYSHTGSNNVGMVGQRHCWKENGRRSTTRSAIFPGADAFIVRGLCRRLLGAGGESITVLGAARRSSPFTNLLRKGFGRYLQYPSGTWRSWPSPHYLPSAAFGLLCSSHCPC